jgi:large subunit ribosomal protein L31
MKKGIHPDYKKAVVTCACGNTFETKSTIGDIKVEVCSSCHPFFSGVQKFMDTDGRVEKFRKRATKTATKTAAAANKVKE